MMDKQRSGWLLLAIVCLGLALRLVPIVTKTAVSHDEAISYLAASGNWGDYQDRLEAQAAPYGRWVAASTWKAFFVPRAERPLAQISQDMARLDVHPPLYFWLLHAAMRLFGFHFWVGPLLNLLLYVLGAVALYALALALLPQRGEALLVTALWAVSPARLYTVAEARQYELFGLCTILFVLLLVRYLRAPTWLAGGLLALATASGLLTHFHFALVVALATAVFLWGWQRTHLRLWLGVATAVGAGGILFVALHPAFLASFQLLGERQTAAAQIYWTGIDMLRRIFAMASTFTLFFVYGGIAQVILFCLFVSGVIWLLLVALRQRPLLQQRWQAVDRTGFAAAYLWLGLTAITMLLYLSLISPLNAMSPRHMNAIWPFMAFLPVLLLRFVSPARRRMWQWLLLALVTLSGVTAVVFDFYLPPPLDTSQVAQAQRVILDNVHEGILPQTIVFVPDEALVFAADQAYLLAHTADWLPDVDANTVYISNLSYTSSELGQQRLISHIEAARGAAVVAGRPFPVGMLFVVK